MIMALVPGINIGVGLFILIILWFITVLVVIALATVPKVRLAIPLVVVVSLVITLALIFYPRKSSNQVKEITEDNIDTVFFGRLVLLILLFLSLVGGFVTLCALHCMEPIYAGRRRTYYITS